MNKSNYNFAIPIAASLQAATQTRSPGHYIEPNQESITVAEQFPLITTKDGTLT